MARLDERYVMTDQHAIVRCSFYVRSAVASGYRYDPVHLTSVNHDGMLPTCHPPLPGDLISLYDSLTHAGGTYRVIERAWLHAGYGSTNWPVLEPLPIEGPMLDIIVEAADGPFRDQAPEPSEDADER